MRHFGAGVALTLLAASWSSWAFKADRHKEFTLLAAGAFSACANQIGVRGGWDSALLSRLADGTRAEDKTQPLTRLMNWHYLHQQDMPEKVWQPPLPFTSHPSLGRIFSHRLGELAAAVRTEDIYFAAGRVAHFIQDMYVPAHVLAIHHGFVLGTDGVDAYPIPPFQSSLSTDECTALFQESIKPSSAGVRKRLCDAASFTRHRIELEIEGTACSWGRVFWCAPRNNACGQAPYPGFGMYQGNPDRFGKSTTFICKERTHSLAKDEYDKFLKPAYEAMLRDTVFMMFVAQARATGKPMVHVAKENDPCGD